MPKLLDVSKAVAGWGDMRLVFVQYSSDQIVFHEPGSLWRAGGQAYYPRH